MKELLNQVRITFPARGENEAFARLVAAGFLMNLGVRTTDLADIKTMVSEAVTNAIVHGYRDTEGKKDVILEMKFYSDRTLSLSVTDHGRAQVQVRMQLKYLLYL